MPLSDTEKEKLREAEILKNEIRKELQPPKPESGLSDFSKQALLLLVGFSLTTVAGGILTTYWKARDLRNQRSYLVEQRALDKASATIERTAKEVAATLAASDDVLTTYLVEDMNQKEVERRWDNWTQTSRNWRVNSEVLSVEIATTFSNKQIDEIFEEIKLKRKLLGNDITNLPRDKKNIAADKKLKCELKDSNDLRNEIAVLLHNCSAAMTDLTKHGLVDQTFR